MWTPFAPGFDCDGVLDKTKPVNRSVCCDAQRCLKPLQYERWSVNFKWLLGLGGGTMRRFDARGDVDCCFEYAEYAKHQNSHDGVCKNRSEGCRDVGGHIFPDVLRLRTKLSGIGQCLASLMLAQCI